MLIIETIKGLHPEAWKAKPAKLRQKDRDEGWTVKFTKVKPAEDGAKRVDIAIPAFWLQEPYRHRRRTKSICQERLAQPGPSQEAEGQADARGHRKSQRKKSKVRAFVEPVFARQKGLMGMFIRTIGLARATMKIGLANLTYNMKRTLWLMTRSATA